MGICLRLCHLIRSFGGESQNVKKGARVKLRATGFVRCRQSNLMIGMGGHWICRSQASVSRHGQASRYGGWHEDEGRKGDSIRSYGRAYRLSVDVKPVAGKAPAVCESFSPKWG